MDSARHAGVGVSGAIYTFVLNFSGTSNFLNNSAGGDSRGGAIWVSENTVLNLSRTNNFNNNTGGFVGGAIYIEYTTGQHSTRGGAITTSSITQQSRVELFVQVQTVHRHSM